MQPRATPGDIEWIDTYGHARICGYTIHQHHITTHEQPNDRHTDGRLTATAKQRIAHILTTQLRDQAARDHAAWNAAGQPPIWHTQPINQPTPPDPPQARPTTDHQPNRQTGTHRPKPGQLQTPVPRPDQPPTERATHTDRNPADYSTRPRATTPGRPPTAAPGRHTNPTRAL